MEKGLTLEKVEVLRRKYGPNVLQDGPGRSKAVLALLTRFKNPLVITLILAASLSLFFGDRPSFFIIISIVFLSVLLDFINTYRSEKAANELKAKVAVTVKVIRVGQENIVQASELVPGDIVMLSAGKVVPADGEIIAGEDLSTNEAALTGESFPQGKKIGAQVYMGSGVVSGTGLMKVTKTGKTTKFAHIAKTLQSTHRSTEFSREINQFSMLVIRITFVLVLFVLIVNLLFHRGLLESVLFSLALAVGLTPELLPLIINLNLTKGSIKMAKEGVIVKQLSAVQNFGGMDILCTDKTGTLTENKIELVKFVDGMGNHSDATLKLGYLVSKLSTSASNPLDSAVCAYQNIDISMYQKIDEIPFDFERKREAVVVHHQHDSRRYILIEGAPEEVIKISTRYQTEHKKINDGLLHQINQTYDDLSADGFRVLAVAQKEIEPERHYQAEDEKGLIFIGFLAFLDPAKKSVSSTIERLESMGITTKIITGDNSLVAQKIARDINLKITGVIEGSDIAAMTRQELLRAVEATTIFARVNPEQKLTIIKALQENGHVVGYMGDGINDAPSLRAADVSVSVDNAVDVAKDAADFIMLRKNLHELTNGVVEGRKTFANTMKYLRMGLSSNFGNMFSMAAASLFLPFLPMLATQILFNNLLYDASQFAIPLDKVDEEEVKSPRILNMKELRRFMLFYGPLSSLFDFLTFGLFLWVFKAGEPLFQAGWFIESIMTQVFVVYIIRTRKIPFKESRPSLPLVLSTIGVVLIALLAVLTPLGNIFNFGQLDFVQVIILMMMVAIYLVMAEILKHWVYAKAITSKAA